jgi:hypothetical protein
LNVPAGTHHHSLKCKHNALIKLSDKKMVELPIYAQKYNYTLNSIENDMRRVQHLKIKINYILDEYDLTFTESSYSYELPKIKEGMTANIIELCRVFILCVNEIKRDSEEHHNILLMLLQDLEDLEYFYYEYKNSNDPYRRHQLLLLVKPYISEIKKIIIKCSELFAKSEDEFAELINQMNV